MQNLVIETKTGAVQASGHDNNRKAASKKRVQFCSTGAMSPPNDRVPASWREMTAMALYLAGLQAALSSVKEIAMRSSSLLNISSSDLAALSVSGCFATAIASLCHDRGRAESVLNRLKDLCARDCSAPLLASSSKHALVDIEAHDLVEMCDLLHPHFASLSKSACVDHPPSNSISPNPHAGYSLLQFRSSWALASVIRARLRWLFDDFPVVPSGRTEPSSTYADCRSGLFSVLQVEAQTLSLFDVAAHPLVTYF